MNQTIIPGNYQQCTPGVPDLPSDGNAIFPRVKFLERMCNNMLEGPHLIEEVSDLNFQSYVRNESDCRKSLLLYSSLFRKQKAQKLRIRNLTSNSLINIF